MQGRERNCRRERVSADERAGQLQTREEVVDFLDLTGGRECRRERERERRDTDRCREKLLTSR